MGSDTTRGSSHRAGTTTGGSSKWVKASLRRETHAKLRKFAEEHNLTSISDAVEFLLSSYGSRSGNTCGREAVTKLRNIEQLLNSLVSGIESSIRALKSDIAELTNAVKELREELSNLKQTKEEKQKKQSKSMVEVMKSVKVRLLSELKLRNPEKFVDKARREGLVVLEGHRDIAIVDPEYWEWFKGELPKLPKEGAMGTVGKLLTFLRENRLIYWDTDHWELVDKE